MRPYRKRLRALAGATLLLLLIPLLAACGASTGAPAATNTAAPAGAEAATSTTMAQPSQPTATTAAEVPQATEPAAAGTDKFLVFGNSGEPDSLDSMDTTAGTALYVTRQIQETLIGFEPGTVNLQPLLATAWTANADATEWTIKLRENVSFHDGTPFDADAVVLNFQRLADPAFEYGFREGEGGKSYPIFPDMFGGYKGDPNSVWKDVEKVDSHTVRFSFIQPMPFFPHYIATSYLGISSPAAIKQHGARYGAPDVGGVGTGPFKFQSWSAGQSITLVRNEEYWGAKARMPGVVVRFIPDAAQRLAELQSGAVNFSVNLSPDAVNTIQGDGNLDLIEREPYNIGYLSLDMTAKPLDDPRVRQAISHAIDKQALVEGFFGAGGQVADNFLPDMLAWARAENLNKYAYDPEKARQLLAEAGYPDGFSTVALSDGSELQLELWYMPVSRPYFPTPQPVAEVIASYLAEVGIEVQLKTEDWGVYLDNWDTGKKHGLVMLGWNGDNGDPNNFLFSHFGPGNVEEAGYRNEQVWELLNQAAAAPGQEQAAQFFKEAGTIVNQDLPRIPIVHAPPIYAARQGLQGWVPNLTSGESFAPIVIEK